MWNSTLEILARCWPRRIVTDLARRLTNLGLELCYAPGEERSFEHLALSLKKEKRSVKGRGVEFLWASKFVPPTVISIMGWIVSSHGLHHNFLCLANNDLFQRCWIHLMYLALYESMTNLWFRKVVERVWTVHTALLISWIKIIPISQSGGRSESDEVTEGPFCGLVMCFYAVLWISGEGFEHAASCTLIRIMMVCGLGL